MQDLTIIDNISINQDLQKGIFSVKDYDKLIVDITTFLESEKAKYENGIKSEIELRECKDSRTNIRKTKEKVKLTRQQLVEGYLGQINRELTGIERLLDESDKVLKEKVDLYTNVEKDKLITLTIKGYNLQQLTQVKEFAEMLGLRAEIK